MFVPRPEGTTVPTSDDFHTWRTVAKWESKSQLMEETSTLFDQRSLSLLTYTQQSLTLVIRGCRRFCRGIFYTTGLRLYAPRNSAFVFFSLICVRTLTSRRVTHIAQNHITILWCYMLEIDLYRQSIVYFKLHYYVYGIQCTDISSYVTVLYCYSLCNIFLI